MTINNIWVFCQVTPEGAATTGSLELLTKARSLGGTVTAFVVGSAGGAAASFGDHGAARVLETGDLAGALPGPAVSAAMQAVIDGGDAPDEEKNPHRHIGCAQQIANYNLAKSQAHSAFINDP